MTAELKSISEGSTMVLTLSTPGQRNALGPQACAAGIEALGGAENNPDVRCVILTGEGAHFCAGWATPHPQADRAREAQAWIENTEIFHGWIDAIRTFPKPVVAAVEGVAAGAGFALALACDFVIAARDAVFASSSDPAVLALPEGGLSWHLAQALPPQRVNEWLMRGGRLPAARLHAHGLVNELTEPGRAIDAALAWAGLLNERAPQLLASIKELVTEARGATLQSHLTSERSHLVRHLHQAPHGASASGPRAGARNDGE